MVKSFFSVAASQLNNNQYNNSSPNVIADAHSLRVLKSSSPVQGLSLRPPPPPQPISDKLPNNPEESKLETGAGGGLVVVNNDVYRKKRLLPEPYIGMWGM